MRVSRTPLALAALLFVAACDIRTEIVAPETTLKSGTWIGTGNYVQDGTGLIGTGNAVEPSTSSTTERGGAGLIGSGNAIADSTSTGERGGIGLLGSGN